MEFQDAKFVKTVREQMSEMESATARLTGKSPGTPEAQAEVNAAIAAAAKALEALEGYLQTPGKAPPRIGPQRS